MLLGADPDELERLATLHDACAAQLEDVVRSLRRAPRRAWTGSAALRWWRWIERDVVPLVAATAARSERSAGALRAHAAEQRRASLGPTPPTVTVHRDTRGDGTWIGRVGAARSDVVVVLVPGVGTDLADVHRLSDDARRVWERVVAHPGSCRSVGAAADAVVLAVGTAARPGGGCPSVAVVSWLGYDPPDHVLGGLDPHAARRGARILAAQLGGLWSAGEPRIVVVGHSYGALVAAEAARRTAHLAAADGDPLVDEVVVLGAPGLGRVHPEGRRAFAEGTGLWVAAARGDAVSAIARLGAVHGADPLRHGIRLPTSRTGHGAYFDDPVLLDAIAGVVRGDVASLRDQPVPSAR